MPCYTSTFWNFDSWSSFLNRRNSAYFVIYPDTTCILPELDLTL